MPERSPRLGTRCKFYYTQPRTTLLHARIAQRLCVVLARRAIWILGNRGTQNLRKSYTCFFFLSSSLTFNASPSPLMKGRTKREASLGRPIRPYPKQGYQQADSDSPCAAPLPAPIDGSITQPPVPTPSSVLSPPRPRHPPPGPPYPWQPTTHGARNHLNRFQMSPGGNSYAVTDGRVQVVYICYLQ